MTLTSMARISPGVGALASFPSGTPQFQMSTAQSAGCPAAGGAANSTAAACASPAYFAKAAGGISLGYAYPAPLVPP
jgi:hypothetical protein